MLSTSSSPVKTDASEVWRSDTSAGPRPKPRYPKKGAGSSDNPVRSEGLTQMSQAHPIVQVQSSNQLDETKMPSHIFFLGTLGSGDGCTLDDIDRLSEEMQLGIETRMTNSAPSLAYQLGANGEFQEMFAQMKLAPLDLKSIENPPLILIDPRLYVGEDSKTVQYHGKDAVVFLNDLIKDLGLSPRQAPRIMIVRPSASGKLIDMNQLKSAYPYTVDSSSNHFSNTPNINTGLYRCKEEDLMEILKRYQRSLS